jgi:hypothetical protein
LGFLLKITVTISLATSGMILTEPKVHLKKEQALAIRQQDNAVLAE